MPGLSRAGKENERHSAGRGAYQTGPTCAGSPDCMGTDREERNGHKGNVAQVEPGGREPGAGRFDAVGENVQD